MKKPHFYPLWQDFAFLVIIVFLPLSKLFHFFIQPVKKMKKVHLVHSLGYGRQEEGNIILLIEKNQEFFI